MESFVDIVCESGCAFPGGISCSVCSLVLGKYVSPFYVMNKLPGRNPLHQLSRGVLHCEDTVSVQLAVVLSRFWNWLEVSM